jgi:ADP-heptose:LPS heptosyltransferase
MNVLILRTSALGDVVHCLPVLRALRRGMPEAKIAWVAEQVFVPLLAGHPDLDLVIPARLRGWRKRPFSAEVRREVAGFVRALRGFRADLALDLMGNHKAGALALLSGARRRLGPARRFRREPSSAVWINETAATPAEHAVDRALEVLRPLGLGEGPADFGGAQLLPDPPRVFSPSASGRIC